MKDIVRRQLAQSIATLQAVHDSQELHATMLEIGHLAAETMKNGGKLLVAGNGGSAADAQHLVAEFVVRLTVNRAALRAVALTTDASILTACGNDYGYDHVFSRQVEALGQKGDVFLGISTSGNSPNVLRAAQTAKNQGLTTIGFTGNGGGKMKAMCDYNVIVPSDVTMNIQEAHLALEHIFVMLVERFTFGIDFDKSPQVLSE
jgi:D-sedoheptulose 7-phosphate isomerase